MKAALSVLMLAIYCGIIYIWGLDGLKVLGAVLLFCMGTFIAVLVHDRKFYGGNK
jgi:ABC-type multidrug transport system permease subunit